MRLLARRLDLNRRCWTTAVVVALLRRLLVSRSTGSRSPVVGADSVRRGGITTDQHFAK